MKRFVNLEVGVTTQDLALKFLSHIAFNKHSSVITFGFAGSTLDCGTVTSRARVKNTDTFGIRYPMPLD